MAELIVVPKIGSELDRTSNHPGGNYQGVSVWGFLNWVN